MDLDHTLIDTKSGNTFPTDINDWVVIEGVPFAIVKYVEDGYKPVIVSNQGGIKLGHSTEKEMHGKFKAVIQEICRIGALDTSLFMYFFCTTNNKENNFRKPNPGMAEAVASMYEVDFENSIMIGDMETDEQFATNAGIGKFMWAEEFAQQGK
jgi:HAD superfamily hydrolase (TIGR01662 family)